MTGLGLRPYHVGDSLPPRSVPVSVVVLTLNEEPNIRRCLASVAWADQVVVVDSGCQEAPEGRLPPEMFEKVAKSSSSTCRECN